MIMEQKNILAVIVGQPNSGKSTIFNLLTRIHQDVGNYPGLTTDARSGHYHEGDYRIEIVDLPGTYSFSTSSNEERIVKNVLLLDRPEVVLVVIDAANFRRHLPFVFDLLEMQLPTIICLSFSDTARRRGIRLDPDLLSQKLKVCVIPMVAPKGEGLSLLREKIIEIGSRDIHKPTGWRNDYGPELEAELADLERKLTDHQHLVEDFPPRWLAVKLLENDREARRFVEHHTHDDSWQPLLDYAEDQIDKYILKAQNSPKKQMLETRLRLAEDLNALVFKRDKPEALHFSDRLDAVACHPFYGLLILAALLFIIFGLTFHLADIWHWIPVYSQSCWEWLSPVELLSHLFHQWLPDWIESIFSIESSGFSSFLRHGVLAGMGGVIQFVPVIFIMFTMLAILEQSGYIARVAMIMDGFMRRFGLQGLSVLPMVLGGGISGGCAVPAIMAARSITNFRQRLLTSLIIPMFNCGGKLPVYAMLIASCFTRGKSLIMVLTVLCSWLIALLSALLLSKTVLKGSQLPLLLEIPSYQFPKLRDVLETACRQSGEFLKKAGTIILAANILLWFLMSFPAENQEKGHKTLSGEETAQVLTAEKNKADFDKNGSQNKVADQASSKDFDRANIDKTSEQQKNDIFDNAEIGRNIETSYASMIGRSLEPISRYAGFDWKDNVAFLSGLAAKEMIVGSYVSLYGMKNGSETIKKDNLLITEHVNQKSELSTTNNRQNDTALTALHASLNKYGPAKVFALLIFIMLYAPCSGTLVAIYRISNSARWVMFSMVYNTVLAFTLAVLVYQIGKLF